MLPQKFKDFFDSQVKKWDTARNNYESLDLVQTKRFRLKDLKGLVQYNPARSVSSLAKVDRTTIEKRRCFLCEKNRPPQQESIEIIPGWELLVNPYPIMPYHFTICSKEHKAQRIDLEIGKELAAILDGMIVFYNDEGAGASAPDHAHFQAVPKESLPLISLIEEYKANSLKNIDLPFKFYTKENDIYRDHSPMNIYFWKVPSKEIKIIGVPRRAHRPKEYYLSLPYRKTISPGAIDIAGVLVTPYEEDFQSISEEDIESIYSQVTYLDE